MTDDLPFASAAALARRIRAGELSPVTVVDAYLDRIDARNDTLGAYVTVRREAAREEARAAERAVEADEPLGPLHGVPVAVKDLFAYHAGTRHTFGSRVFEGFVPERSAPVVERLVDAGAIVLGKTNTPEFGNRPTTDNDLVGTTVTPFDTGRTAGGTSGGSAAAVADGLAPVAQGSDAGGSIRIPAACCGVYGLKPSFGRVPNGNRPNAFDGHTPFVQHGPLARTVADAALFLDVTAGPHPADPFTHPDDDRDYVDAVDRSIADLSIAYSPDLGLFPVDPAVESAVAGTLDAFTAEGATVERVDVSYGRSKGEVFDAWRTYFQLLMAGVATGIEAGHGVDLLGDHRDEIDPLFVRIVEAGREHSATDVQRADVVRTDVYDAIRAVFAEYDLLVTPTLSVVPFEVGTGGPSVIAGEPADPYLDWILSWVFNMTDHPAASVPGAFLDGLPVGVQLVGPRFDDRTVFAASAAVERQRPWQDRYPGRNEGTVN
jgi:Asp-tRNA(Asn)/Glu-tRNA(Gln) amidotransferase A subunit family amidase